MATRCNIIIKGKSCGKNVKTMLYRHWDGYPICTGVELMDLLNKQTSDCIYFDGFINSMIKEGNTY